MTCPFKMANCGTHETWEEEYGHNECVQHTWDFCTDPIDPENFTAVSQQLRKSIDSDSKRIDGRNCGFYGDQENCPVPWDEPVNCDLFHLCETVTTQNKHKER